MADDIKPPRAPRRYQKEVDEVRRVANDLRTQLREVRRENRKLRATIRELRKEKERIEE